MPRNNSRSVLMDDIDIKWPTTPGWAKMIVGAAVAGIMWWKLPMLEILSIFFYLVIIPLALFSAVGLVGKGTVESFSDTWNLAIAKIRQRAENMHEDLMDAGEDDELEEPPPRQQPTRQERPVEATANIVYQDRIIYQDKVVEVPRIILQDREVIVEKIVYRDREITPDPTVGVMVDVANVAALPVTKKPRRKASMVSGQASL